MLYSGTIPALRVDSGAYECLAGHIQYVAVRADDGAIGHKQLNNSVCFGRVG